MDIFPILVLLIIFSTVFGIFYLFITTRNRERILMIEKNYDPQQFLRRPRKGPSAFTYWTLKLGMLATGISLGIMVGTQFVNYEEGPLASSIFFFAGAFLIGNFFLERMIWKKDDKELNN